MAILQTGKDLFPIRRLYQRHFLRQWFARKSRGSANAVAVEADLIALATDGDHNAFYDLPIEQLRGQVSAAAQVVLEDPAAHEALLRCLASQAPAGAVDRLVSVKQPLRRTFDALKKQGEPADDSLQSLSDAKARVMHQVQRSIDGLQISAAYRWKFGFRITSFVLSFSIALIATNSTDWPFATRLFVGLAAGFLAPVARDLQAKLQHVK